MTIERLIERLSYNSETGVFIWKPRQVFTRQDKSWNTRHAGKETGYVRTNGYKVIIIDGKEYVCSRLAWLYSNGVWPNNEIDHINCDRQDNRIINLREATRSENSINKFIQKNNTSGFKGVWKRKNSNRWIAEIGKKGFRKKLGSFRSPEEASEAYKAAAKILHGSFAKL